MKKTKKPQNLENEKTFFEEYKPTKHWNSLSTEAAALIRLQDKSKHTKYSHKRR